MDRVYRISFHQMKRSALTLLVLWFISLSAIYSQPYTPGTTYFGRAGYIEYTAGNLPVIISAPHGGALTPDEIPDRTCGTETVTDSYTANLAREIGAAIFDITGCYPHIIINNLKRIKLDANRDIGEAACGNEYAEQAWNEFQNYIDSAKKSVTTISGKGLFIDLHGHGHAIQRLELGYLLSATELRYSDETLNTSTYVNMSSIHSLALDNVTGLTHSGLIRGITSLGSLFATKGFASVPSIDDPYPLSGQSYFSGGYNTDRHGSRTEGTIDGIQIECNQDVRFIESARLAFADGFAEVTLDYLINHYFPDLPSTYCNGSGVEEPISSHFLLYPNPVKDILYIRNREPSDLRIYNSLGMVVLSASVDAEDEVSLEKLQNGLYLVALFSHGKMLHSEKIIKESNR